MPKRIKRVTVTCHFCGGKTERYPNRLRNGPMFCDRECRTAYRRKHMTSKYIEVVINKRRVFQHRAVMEEILGRKLAPYEQVHHKNHNGHDNRPNNLELTTNTTHAKLHLSPKTKQIIRLNKAGLTNSDIGKLMGMNTASVWWTLHRQGLKAKNKWERPIKWDLDRAKYLFFSKHKSFRKIGKILGVSGGAIRDRFEKLGIYVRRTRRI